MFANSLNSVRKFHSNKKGLGTLPLILILVFVAVALLSLVAGKVNKHQRVEVQLGNTTYYVEKK